jgi:Calcineurin-like phosphoesterase
MRHHHHDELIRKYSLTPSPDYLPLLCPGQRLIVVGDIHGDYNLLVNRLRTGRVLEQEQKDENNQHGDDGGTPPLPRWKRGETAIVVQVGDLLDRGSRELDCLVLLARLSHEAAKWGGAVIVLLGNHEMMNIGGDFRCVVSNDPWKQEFDGYYAMQHDSNDWKQRYFTPSPQHKLSTFPARWAACQPGGILASCFFTQCKVAVQVGSTVCVHAHWNDRCFQAYKSISAVNRRASAWLTDSCCPWDATGDERFMAIDASMEQTFPVPDPFWGRPTGTLEKEEGISGVLSRFATDARRLVVGHERCDHIHQTTSGYIWKVDAPNQADVLLVNHLDKVQVLKPRPACSPIRRRLAEVLLNRLTLWLVTLLVCQAALRVLWVGIGVGTGTQEQV